MNDQPETPGGPIGDGADETAPIQPTPEQPAAEQPSTEQAPTDAPRWEPPAPESTAAFPTYPGHGFPTPASDIASTGPVSDPAADSPFGQPLPAASAAPAKQRRGGLAAAVVAAALVAGGIGGFGGAAAWNAVDDGGNSSASSSASPSSLKTADSVVDSTDTTAADGSVEKVAATVLPSVVKIYVQGSTEAGSGSGIILSSDGKILTNNHVVEVAGDNGTITVAFNDGSTHSAKVLGTDPLTDTAVIQADGVSGLTPATFGKSTDLKVGQDVVAIGSPFGLESTVTSGIVSALDRPVDVGSDGQGNSTVYPAIQTDAAINPGNSGGPLVDMAGHVVGINASIQTASSGSSSPFGGTEEGGSIGLGFAIPIDEVQPIIEQMLNGETPTHARLGISVTDAAASDSAAEVGLTNGAKIAEIGDESTAAKAGLQKGDVITKVDDHVITGSDSLVATIRSYRPGDQVTVTYTRGGQEKTATLSLDSDAQTTNS
ncbi:S1C family serine protease [Nocardioides fonticola]